MKMNLQCNRIWHPTQLGPIAADLLDLYIDAK